MTDVVLAAGDTKIEVGVHSEWNLFGLSVHADTILSTLVASALLLGLGFYVRAKITSGVPNGPQLFFESVTQFLRDQIETSIGVRTAPFLVPLSIGLFLFILFCNWMVILPLHHYLPPPTADVNLVYPLALMVFFWKHIAGAIAHGGPGKQFIHVAKGHLPVLAPMWFFEEITSVVSHSLRLFGNIFAGGVMLSLFTLIPAYITWLPTAGWKLFDLFIGLVQAFIFAFLTIIYFSQSMENREEAH
jgi:F-type H+-transporting ATPase subunit a